MSEYSYYDNYEPTARELFPDDDPARFEQWKARQGYGIIAGHEEEGRRSAGSQDPIPPKARQGKPKAVKDKELAEFKTSL